MNYKYVLVITFLLSMIASYSVAEDASYYIITEKEAREYITDVKSNKHHNVLDKKDAVPNKETAIALALVVWESIYGKKQIKKQAPYQAMRIEDCWYVTGSLPKGWRGGTAGAVILARDGAFLNVSHGK
jgi:uncharacterized protein YyaL (SSP411 family)